MALNISKIDLFEYLKMQNQKELIESYEKLSTEAQDNFLNQLAKLNYQYPDLIQTRTTPTPIPTDSLKSLIQVDKTNAADSEQGIKALKDEVVSTLILAGGDGSRLDFDMPKACFPISPLKKKSLIELKIETISSIFSSLNIHLPIFLLTSEQNIKDTTSFLEHQTFLDKISPYLEIIEQPSLPFVSDNNKWFLSSPEKLAKGPNGNGGFLQALFQSGYFDKLETQGIQHLVVAPIDNPLANPFDTALIGRHIRNENDITFYCNKRTSLKENTGLVAFNHNHLSIIDYNNLNETLYTAHKKEELAYPYGNTNLFCISLSFLRRCFEDKKLPIHWVKKKMRKYDAPSQSYHDIWGWKGEKFITDLVSLADKPEVVYLNRFENFAPIKTLEGPNGINFVHDTIYEKNRRIFERVTGEKTSAKFELAMKYYTPFFTPKFPKDQNLNGLYIE